jgi:predicted transcriptional regulator
MKSDRLAKVLERVEAWPAEVQDELADLARDLDDRLKHGDYEPSDAELAGIDRGLADANAGRFATDEQVEAALRKLRGA